MASSGEVEVTAEVQAYLDKHRISNLFQVRERARERVVPAMNARPLPSSSSSISCMNIYGITTASQLIVIAWLCLT